MGIRAVSFDLGHTLLFPRYGFYLDILEKTGICVERADLEHKEADLRQWFDDHVLTEGLDDGLWERYFREFFAGLGAREGDMIPLLLELHREHTKGLGLWTEPAPGAVEVLEHFSASDHKLACVSNNDGRLEAMVEGQGWSGYFDLLVDSRSVGCSKPDPEIFHHALEKLGLEPHEMIHVGDYYSVDVVGPRRAGVTGVLFDPMGAYRAPDCTVIKDLEEIVDIVD